MEVIRAVLVMVGAMDPPPTPEQQIFAVIASNTSDDVKRKRLSEIHAAMGADAFKRARNAADQGTPIMWALQDRKYSIIEHLVTLGSPLNLGIVLKVVDSMRGTVREEAVNLDTDRLGTIFASEPSFPLRIAIRLNRLDLVQMFGAHGQKYTANYKSAL